MSRADSAGSVEAYHVDLLLVLTAGFACDVAMLDEVSFESRRPVGLSSSAFAGELVLALSGPCPPFLGIWLGRVDRDFSEQDALLAELLAPHLQAAELRLRRAAARALLTAREREVLDLVAGGASNGDVATTMVVSPKTVKKHLEHVYAKLGVRSRAEAAWLTCPGQSAGPTSKFSLMYSPHSVQGWAEVRSPAQTSGGTSR